MKTIDNFQKAAYAILKFNREDEFYLVMILRRKKDVKDKLPEGVNEDNRLIKHYFVYSREYLESKEAAIKALCDQNDARAYILPQRRCCRNVLWALHDKVSALLKENNRNTHFDHLIRTTVAGMHETAEKWHKRWVIDIDGDDEDTINRACQWIEKKYKYRHMTDDELRKVPVEDVVREFAFDIGCKLAEALGAMGERSADAVAFMKDTPERYEQGDIFSFPTPHGWHIVTPPFNRDQKALAKYFGGFYLKQDWIKPDAMALLYAPASVSGQS